MNNHSGRLTALEDLLTQRERLAEAENLREVAEAARAKLLALMAMARAGVLTPTSTAQHGGPHREALCRRLIETRERLLRFGAIRERES
jgi:hypothetical protein